MRHWETTTFLLISFLCFFIFVFFNCLFVCVHGMQEIRVRLLAEVIFFAINFFLQHINIFLTSVWKGCLIERKLLGVQISPFKNAFISKQNEWTDQLKYCPSLPITFSHLSGNFRIPSRKNDSLEAIQFWS